MTHRIAFVDSHTAGEPTRVILNGGPDLGSGTLQERLDRFRSHHDSMRRAMVTEPRGADVLIGALRCEPSDASCDSAVIFFNNVGYLGMCGHGLIGFVETLRYLGEIKSDRCRVETPVGVVEARVNPEGSISFDNVPSYRKAAEAVFDVPGVGQVVGDVAWGGNWFFLTRSPKPRLRFDSISKWLKMTTAIRKAVNENGYPEVDHIELFDDPLSVESHSRNFVLCPGLEYDRSPCGTGTSAKLACLAADGLLKPGEVWIQEGILGTSFSGRYRWEDEANSKIIPTISGKASITIDGNLLLQDDDPFRYGICLDESFE